MSSATAASARFSLPHAGAVTGDIRPHVTLYLVLIAAYLMYDYCSYFLPDEAGHAVIFVLAIAILIAGFCHLQLGFALFTVALIFSDDISRIDPIEGNLNSLMTVPIAGVAVGNLVAIGLIALTTLHAILEWLRTRATIRLHMVDQCVIGILVIYAAATIHGYAWVVANPRGALNDLNLPIMLGGLYFCMRYGFRDVPPALVYFQVLICAMAAKATVWLIFFAFGIGFEFGTTIKVSNESGRVLLILLFAWGMILQLRGLGAGMGTRLLGLVFAATAALNLLIQAQRGPWLAASFALGVLILLGSVRDKLRWAMSTFLSVLIVAFLVLQFKPDALETVGYHASTLRFWDEHLFLSSQSTRIRMYEFRNIHAQLVDHGNVVLGDGPGSVFTDRFYPFPFPLLDDDYSREERASREFHNAHGLFQNLMLNIGYGGMIVYLGLLALIYGYAYWLFRRAGSPEMRVLLLSILAFLPAMGYYAWSPKTNMLLGVFIGLLGCLAHASRVSHGTHEHASRGHDEP